MEIETGDIHLLKETNTFPRNPAEELAHLRELVEDKEIDIQSIGEVGYIAFNKQIPYVAEASLALLDWDDTAAQTTKDKQRCYDELKKLGISQDIISYCDKLSRVRLLDGEEQVYEPELEMRALTTALKSEAAESSSLGPELKSLLDDLREKLLHDGDLTDFDIDPRIKEIFEQTRFTSTLYEDTLQTLHTLKGNPTMPFNVGILTYGDPSFQLEKVKQVFDGEDVNMVLLTKVRKGKFFQEFLEQNPLKDAPLQYTYSETPRDDGVHFANWNVPVILFDDDPKQVASFKNIAQTEGLTALGVTRVRREGIKRSEQDVNLTGLVDEIKPSDTYLDTELFHQSFHELVVKSMENWMAESLIPDLRTHADAMTSDVQQILRGIAVWRKKDYLDLLHEVLTKAGYDPGSYEENSTLWFNPETQQQLVTYQDNPTNKRQK